MYYKCSDVMEKWKLNHMKLQRASQEVILVKNPFANAGGIREVGSISELGRSPGGRHGNPLQYSCLENPMDIGTWQTMVHRVAKGWTQLK